MPILFIPCIRFRSLARVEVNAQVVKRFVVNTREVPIQVIPQTGQIRYPNFKNGFVYYTTGKRESFKLNYSMLYGEMQYINTKGDTMALVNEQMVQKVVINKEEFYSLYGKGYVEVLASYAPLKLACQQFLKILWGEGLPKGDYTYPASGSKHSADVITLKEVYHQPSKGHIKIGKEGSCVLIDRNQRFYRVNKSVLF